jgi:site-specific DNA-methyltransferase (adenine-specific)
LIDKIILGDCLEIMQDIPSGTVDMVLCDLPYGTTTCAWDTVIPFDKLWGQYSRVCKPDAAVVLFGQEPFTSYLRLSNIKNFRYDWYWEKERLTNVAQVKRRAGKTVETISVFYTKQCTYNPQMQEHNGPKRTNRVSDRSKQGAIISSNSMRVKEYTDTGLRYPTQVLRFQRDILKSNLHPTQKPLALCEFLVRTYSNEFDTVLDNCIGSGTTAIACMNTNRHFIGIERDAGYVNVANERISKHLDSV